MEENLEPYISLSEDQIKALLIQFGAHRAFRQGDNIQADHCVLHDNHSPTLGIHVEYPHKFNCFNPGCKKGKDIVSFVAAYHSWYKNDANGKTVYDRQKAIAWLIDFGATTVSENAFDFADKVEAVPRFELPEVTLAAYDLDSSNGWLAIKWWAEKRGACWAARLIENKLWATALELGYDRHAKRLIFPVRHADGVLAGLVGRAMHPSDPVRYYNYDEGKFLKGMCLMGAHNPIDKSQPIVLVEGPTDYINMCMIGFKNVRGLMGAKFTDEQVSMLVELGHPLVPMFDLDDAGKEARRKFTRAVNKRIKLLTFSYPEEAFDHEGKADPGRILPTSFREVLASFSQYFPSF